MNLRLDLTRPGRKPAPLSGEVLGELRSADLELLASGGSVEMQDLKRITDRHHALARALAAGLSESEAAAVTGYTASRISVLKASPAFQDLLALYRKDVEAQFTDFHSRLAGVAADALQLIQDKLESEEADDIPLPQLLEVAKMGADRTGFGPTHKQDVTVNINLAERLEAARARARQLKDITPRDENDEG